MPAQLGFFETLAQIFPLLLLGVVVGGRVMRQVVWLWSIVIVASTLIVGETASLYVLATGKPGLWTTWIVTVSLAVGLVATAVDTSVHAYTRVLLRYMKAGKFRSTAEAGKAMRRRRVLRTSDAFLWLLIATVFLILPTVVVVMVTIEVLRS